MTTTNLYIILRLYLVP